MLCKVISEDRSYHDVQKNHRSISKDKAMVKMKQRHRQTQFENGAAYPIGASEITLYFC
jgi:hypothetical protein